MSRRRSARHHLLVATLAAIALTLGVLPGVHVGRAAAATCPCTIFTAAQSPTVTSDPDTVAVELGVKFRADQAGSVTGIRFWKGSGNTGTHTGSLWSGTGTRLATATFTGETASGWQQASFASPVAITPGVTYTASYLAPNGRYASDESYFTSAVVRSPLTALASGTDGGNGVYRYGSGGGFPTSSYKATNYWVDVVFDPSGADTTPPTLTDRQPAPGATGASTSGTVTATFSEDVVSGTPALALTSAGGTAVTATVTYDSPTRTVTLRPGAALATGATYTARVSGARDAAGNQMAAVTWSFTTAAAATACPCSLWPDTAVPATPSTADSSAVEVGLKFRASQAGYVTGIRFYKGSGNSGTHTGSLWTASGTRLGTATFTAEGATGWQTAPLGAPVPVSANTTYVVSYYAPVVRYSSNGGFFSTATTRGPLTALANGGSGGNGVYRYGASGFPTSSYQSTNYWVDVVFDTSSTDTVAPTVVSRTPGTDAAGVPAGTTVSARFSEAVTSTSPVIELRRTDDGTAVAGTTAYDAGTQTATLTPSASLQASTGYTATVRGAADTAGNTMTPVTWSFTTSAPPPPGPDQGPGGPIAVVTSAANPSSSYLAEILRTEGLNAFTTVDVSTIGPATLAGFDVVVLGAVDLDAARVSALTDWVTAGGNLIAMRPTAALGSLLGITPTGAAPLTDGYLKVDTTTPAGAGITPATVQFHGPATLYSLAGAQAVAGLYANASAATTNPAVTLRSVGPAGGEAAAFTYDLAASVIATRQGNQAWAGTDRDGMSPIRSDDLYFGGSSARDWVDLDKVAIPQADEQQRLLTNLMQVMNRDRKPLPRFWYFPRGLKAVVVATGDDHGNGGTAGRFDQYNANSPAGCSVMSWTCLRFSSYVYPSTPGLSDTAAAAYSAQGFEVGVHESTGCGNFTPSSLAQSYAGDIASWQLAYPSLKNLPPVSNRTHCIVYSDWASQPRTELANGMRLDGNYYYWPAPWVANRPGFMTGSGMPMRFADTDGSMIDVYQAATQMTDESDQTYPYTPDTLIENATGPLGYYGAFTANMHTDAATTPQSDAVLSSAIAHNVPVVSGRQMVTWLDGRNGSSFSGIAWGPGSLTFTVQSGAGSTGLTAMLPTAGPSGAQLTGLTRVPAAGGGSTPVATTTSTVKGLEYASFDAAPGTYTASYAAATAPAVTALAVDQGAPTAAPETTVAWSTASVASSRLTLGTSSTSLTRTLDVADTTRRHAVTADRLKAGVRYYYRVSSTDLNGRTVTYPAPTSAPASFTTPAADLTAPTVTAARVTPLPGGIATLRWTTNEPSTAVVQVGESSTTMRDAARDDALSTSHALVLSGLRPNTTYSVRGVSTDEAGNSGRSGTLQFVTPAWGVGEQGTPTFSRGAVTGAAAVDPTDLGRVTLRGATATARSGTYTSVPLDAQQMVTWDRAIWDGRIPSGAGAALLYRTGSTSVPDASWSAWQRMPADASVSGGSRYLQYQVQLSSPAGVASPDLWAMGFTHSGDEPAHSDETSGR